MKTNFDYDELINLQKQYNEGKIKEEDIPTEKLNQLKELYYKQISILENAIEKDKDEILKIRKRISNKYRKRY